MSGKYVFRFHLGPVQGFIAQARRTRDLWAGSFLLSFLAAHAMVAVRRQGFEIDFPTVEKDGWKDPLIRAIEGNGAGEPLLATVPNQFMASGDGDFDPDEVTEAVQKKWKCVADAVKVHFVVPHLKLGNDTEAIWDQQIAGFWEMYWVLDERDGSEGAWLDQRKNWRTHRMPDQGGEHCVLMGEWQEISGHSRIGKESRKKHEAFWAAMRDLKLLGSTDDNHLDLRPGERLCAMALVKRLFPRLPAEVLTKAVGWVPSGHTERIKYWHSTGHVAAARWLQHIEKHRAVVDACDRLASFVEGLSDRHFGEQHARIACVEQLHWFRDQNTKHHFASLDSNFLRADDIVNDRSLPLFDRHGSPLDDKQRIDPQHGMIPERIKARDLHRAIMTAIQTHNDTADEVDRIKFEEPPPYYAMLLMDGDKVGELLGSGQDPVVSEAMSRFTRKVAQRFAPATAEFDGVLIYAGGDDVLALMTVEDAIPAAVTLADDYREAFAALGVKTPNGGDPDISAAIVFADHHEPFRDVSTYAHKLLENVAKDGNCRASLAIEVRKPSGQAAEWVGKWRLPDGCEPPLLLLKLAKERTYSNRFPYNLRARYIAPAMGKFAEIEFGRDELTAIFSHEIGKSREQGGAPTKEAVAEMLTLSQPRASRRQAGIDEAGLLVVRFLDQYGIL